VEAETCSDTLINNTNKNLLVAIVGILSERLLVLNVREQWDTQNYWIFELIEILN
jgi:hypothetical protein